MLLALTTLLSGCSTVVLDPKGPMAKIQSDTILLSILVMAVIVITVYILFVVMIVKYRATKKNEGYEPPHEEGNKWLEIIWTAIPILIVIFLSVVTVKTTNAVETTPEGYGDQPPLVIYAASSDWKWHFSYPEEGIETVNYLNIPTGRPIEFRLYSFSTITSFWIPQLAGQKYAMSDHITTLHMAADTAGEYWGKNANFNGKGFAHMDFEVMAMTPTKFNDWVKDVKTTAPALTEEEFNSVLNTSFVGRKSYSTTHLTFRPAPGKHNHSGEDHADHTDSTGMNMPAVEGHVHH